MMPGRKSNGGEVFRELADRLQLFDRAKEIQRYSNARFDGGIVPVNRKQHVSGGGGRQFPRLRHVWLEVHAHVDPNDHGFMSRKDDILSYPR